VQGRRCRKRQHEPGKVDRGPVLILNVVHLRMLA
jgi:hypothetical protein